MPDDDKRVRVWTEIRTVTDKLCFYSKSRAFITAAYYRQRAPRTVHPPDLLIQLLALLDAHLTWINSELPEDLRRTSWRELLDPRRTDEAFARSRDEVLRSLHDFASYRFEKYRAKALMDDSPNCAQGGEAGVDSESVAPGSGAKVIIKNPENVFMNAGDVFNKIQGSPIANRSTVDGSFNDVRQDLSPQVFSALSRLTESVISSRNGVATNLLDELKAELAKQRPDPSRLRKFWGALVQALPTITAIADLVKTVLSPGNPGH